MSQRLMALLGLTIGAVAITTPTYAALDGTMSGITETASFNAKATALADGSQMGFQAVASTSVAEGDLASTGRETEAATGEHQEGAPREQLVAFATAAKTRTDETAVTSGPAIASQHASLGSVSSNITVDPDAPRESLYNGSDDFGFRAR